MIINLVAVVISIIGTHALAESLDEGTCYPAGTPCPSHYKTCLRVQLNYTNTTGDSSNDTMNVDEVISITPQYFPTVQRLFKKQLITGKPIDCLIDSTVLDSRTSLSSLSIKLHADGYVTDNCQITLNRNHVIGNHSYVIGINKTDDTHISCTGNL